MSVFRFFVPLSLLSLLPLTTEAQDPNFLFHVCSNPPTSPENSTYYSNLNILLSNFSSKANDSKFFSGKSGQDPNTVYGFFSCAGDLSQATCQDCVTVATKDVTEKCPVEQEAVIWYSECLLMFSNVSFSSNNQNTSETPALTWNLRNVTGNTTRFDETVMMAMKDLKDQAAPSPERSATSEVNNATNPFTNLYSIVQCLPQLSSAECDECLQGAIAKFPSCCSGKTGGRVLTSRCYARYELYPFFNRSESPGEAGVPTSTIIDPADKPTSNWIQIVGGVTAVVTVAVAGFLAFKAWRMRKNRRKNIPLPSFGAVNQEFQDENVEFPSIQLDIINAATQHFSEENKIGKGGFGTVYKGVLADGKEIAVKRLSETSRQGIIEFKNEIVLIARLQHRNLVRLLGCCLESNEKLLVYEYMPNRSLDVFLFDAKLGVQLDWQKRFNIISGIARGILYLHEDSRLRIIHRDLKVSNILLDSEMNPKISDFGLARIFGGNQNEASTKRHVGTYGYMAPEYAMEGLFSVKSDVFSFGVLLLEIISGKKNNGFYICERYKSLLTSAWELWSEGRGMELIDPVLVQAYVESEVLKCIHIGLLCVQNDRAHRPTMSSVYRMLGSESIALPKPTEPAFFAGRVITEQDLPSDNIMCSTNELTLSNVEPR